MLEVPRVKILDVKDFPSRKYYDEFDTAQLLQHPLILRRGKVKYTLGVVRRAYKGRDEIFADIIIQGGFKGFVTKPHEKTGTVEVKSVELILK
jgi:hypothetical protein